MKKVTALAAAVSACLLAGSLAAQEPATRPGDTSTTTRPADRASGQDLDRDEATRSGQGATTDEMPRQRTADASGMRRSRLDTEDFAKQASAAGAAEVELGKLAQERATNPEVKAYAQRMVADHTKANKELMSAAQAKNVEVRSEPDLMHKAMREKFEHQKADADFDHDFMQQMVRDHQKVVELFENASTSTSVDPDFRAWAKKTLPTLQEHLEEARRLEAKLAKSQD
jgi:putative membrane protein